MNENRQKWELLNESEKQFLKPVEQIINNIIARYHFVQDTADIDAVNDKQNEEFKKACEENGIDIKRAVSISTKLFSIPWYSYYISNVKSDNNDFITIFSLYSSKNSTPITLDPEEYKDFYKIAWDNNGNPDEVYPVILKSLNLEKNFKFVHVEDLEALSTIAEVYTEQTNGVLIPRTGGRRIKSLDYPIDKPNNKIWNMKEGEGHYIIDTTRNKAKTKATTLYSINFENLTNAKITKALDPFDKRVYFATAALYNAGNKEVTIPQIYNAMGYDSTLSQYDRKKIDDSITKMASANILIDNEQEIKAGYSYPRVLYDAPLLPMERVRMIINGELVEGAIHLFREPPMMSFARGRKQITTVDRELLLTPVNKTNTNLSIEDYLIRRIAQAHNGKSKKRILFSTIYEEAHLGTTKKQQRARSTITKILDHYVKHNFISKYTIDDEGISFTFGTKKP